MKKGKGKQGLTDSFQTETNQRNKYFTCSFQPLLPRLRYHAGPEGDFLQRTGETETIDRLFLYLALCLHTKASEHFAPIMFPPFSLSPIGLSVVEPMGVFLTHSNI